MILLTLVTNTNVLNFFLKELDEAKTPHQWLHPDDGLAAKIPVRLFLSAFQ